MFVNESPGEGYIALNTARKLFADDRLRRAVAFAIDRAALAAQTGPDFDPMHPTDQYLAPSVPASATPRCSRCTATSRAAADSPARAAATPTS